MGQFARADSSGGGWLEFRILIGRASIYCSSKLRRFVPFPLSLPQRALIQFWIKIGPFILCHLGGDRPDGVEWAFSERNQELLYRFITGFMQKRFHRRLFDEEETSTRYGFVGRMEVISRGAQSQVARPLAVPPYATATFAPSPRRSWKLPSHAAEKNQWTAQQLPPIQRGSAIINDHHQCDEG